MTDERYCRYRARTLVESVLRAIPDDAMVAACANAAGSVWFNTKFMCEKFGAWRLGADVVMAGFLAVLESVAAGEASTDGTLSKAAKRHMRRRMLYEIATSRVCSVSLDAPVGASKKAGTVGEFVTAVLPREAGNMAYVPDLSFGFKDGRTTKKGLAAPKDKQSRRTARLRAEGKCGICGKAVTDGDYAHCGVCREKRRRINRESYRRRKGA